MSRRRTTLLLSVFLVAPVLGGCPSTRGRRSDDPCRVDAGEGNRPFLAGTAARREAVDALVASLGRVRGPEFMELGRKILMYGDAAVPPLLAALKSDDPAVREHAAYLLGARRDRRTIEDLVLVTCDEVPRVRYEAATALLEMKDPRAFDVLVQGLDDPDARLRAKCLEVLAEATGQRFGFEADGDPADREAAVRRWRAWLAQRETGFDPACDVAPVGDPIEASERSRERARPKDPLSR